MKTHRLLLVSVLAVLAGLALPGSSPWAVGAEAGPGGQASTRPAGGVTERTCRAALKWFDSPAAKVERLIPVAEAAAERLVRGGTLYVAGNYGFVDEMVYRAGGFPFTQEWSGQKLGPNDVLLIGRFRPREAKVRYAEPTYVAAGPGRFGSGLVVYLAGRAWPEIRRMADMVDRRRWSGRLHVIDTGAPRGWGLEDLCVGQTAAIALAWAFSGEVIAAATRKGKTLATYASDWEPNGRRWDQSVKGRVLHPKYSVPPIPGGSIARRYMHICRDDIAAFLAAEPERVRLAAKRMARCLRRGAVVWITCDGHVHPRGSVVPAELTGMVLQGRSYDWWHVGRYLRRGDVLLYMGYLRYPRRAIDGALRRGAEAVVVCVDAGPTNSRLTHIRGHWTNYDTCIDLPNYPIRVLPVSGVVQTPQWYSLMAETLSAMRAASTPGAQPAWPAASQ